uniref:Ig-like domain-containing protein n=1 Tax=Pyxicephalus adspersus TaxID=30357 RepID=A0AAV2ZKG1_PYXAD|nr:TPA: hypothetical protein GDO54_005061 [Pyxicephalus adspersus]
MSCDVEPAASYYEWYHNTSLISSSKVYAITFAETRHSGDYWCSTNTGGRSEKIKLSVSNGPVILQAPLHVYEGDDVSLRCHSPQGRSARQTTFYRNNQTIQTSATDPDVAEGQIYRIRSARVGNSGLYQCQTYLRKSAAFRLDVSDKLFSKPDITAIPYSNITAAGTTITLVCNTNLSPLRMKTELQFAFYRDGQEVKNFSLSNEFEVRSAQVEDSGNYSCKVRTSIKSVSKMSEYFFIQVQEPNITAIPYSNTTTDGNNMTLVCNTNLSPLRMKTELQFAFYRNGQKVRNFSPSNKYEVQSAQLEDSGNYYFCEVRNANNSVKKRSEKLYIQVQGECAIVRILGSLREIKPKTYTDIMYRRQELQFAFYRDGRVIQNFNLSNQYELWSSQLENSGNYYCKIRTISQWCKQRE